MTKNKNIFKAIFSIALLLCCAFFLTACGGAPDGEEREQRANTTQSYATACSQFRSVTGIELPAIDGLEAEEYQFVAGAQEYCLDITSGEALNFTTYMLFENFFVTTLGNCDSGYPAGSEAAGRSAEWTIGGRWYQTIWDAGNQAIYINTTLRQTTQMTDRYASGRQNIYQITGYWIPELENVEVDYSSFDVSSKAGRFDFWADRALYGTFIAYMKDLLPEEPILEEDDDVTWEFDATVNGNDARYNIEINFVVIQGGSYISIHLQVRDLYDISLEATMGGSVTLSMGGHIYTSNTATVIAGDNLILSAESDLNYNFVGWYIDNTWIASSNPYTYTMPAQDVVVQGKFERQAVQMTDSYKLGRSVFQSATGVTLPEIENIEGDIFFDGDSVMFDIVSGENLSKDTYDDILAYLDELDGWTGVDATQSEEYPTKTYTNSTTGASFQVVWNGESVEGGIYLNTISALTYDAYSATRTYLATLFGLVLPEMASTEFAVNISFSCGADLSYMTLDMEKTTNFTQEEYNTFVMMLSELGDGVDVGEEGFNKKVEWTLDDIIEGELYLTIEWDLATTIAINISEIVDNTK